MTVIFKAPQTRFLALFFRLRRGKLVGQTESQIWQSDAPTGSLHRIAMCGTGMTRIEDGYRAWPPTHFKQMDAFRASETTTLNKTGVFRASETTTLR